MNKFFKAIKSLFNPKFYKFMFSTLPFYVFREGFTGLSERLARSNAYYHGNMRYSNHMHAYLKPTVAELSKKLDACENLKYRPVFFVEGGSGAEKQIYPYCTASRADSDYIIELPPGSELTRDALFEIALQLNVCKFHGEMPSKIYFGYCFSDGKYSFEPLDRACAKSADERKGHNTVMLTKVLVQFAEEAGSDFKNGEFPVTHYMFGYPRADARLFRRIILYRHDAMGDAMLTLPTVRKIRKAFPNAHICMVCNARNTEFWSAQPEIDTIIDFIAEDGGKFLRDIPELKSLHKKVKKNKYDLSVQLSQDPEHFFIPMDWADFSAGFVDTHAHALSISAEFLPRESGDPTNCGMGDRIKHIANALFDEPDLRRELTLPPESIQAVDAFVRTTAVMKREIIVGVHFGGSSSEREWGTDKFTKLIDLIIERFHAGVLLIGGTREAEKAQEMVKASKYPESVLSVAGRFSVMETAALMKKLDMFIGNNSGPAHIAGIQGTPVLVLWQGSAPPISWTPQGRYVMQVLKPMKCMPCYYDGCSHDQKCIVSIGVDDAFKAFEKLLCMTGKLEVS